MTTENRILHAMCTNNIAKTSWTVALQDNSIVEINNNEINK
jgi:hypothetical protein